MTYQITEPLWWHQQTLRQSEEAVCSESHHRMRLQLRNKEIQAETEGDWILQNTQGSS